MHLLYADETNTDPDTTDFFIYAGIVVQGDCAAALSGDIEGIRKRHGYQPGDILKFNTVERPKHISPDKHRDAKREVIEAATGHGTKLITSFISHKIATSPEEARRREINRICYHFDCYLHWVQDTGLVLLDTFQDDRLAGILREKFAVGLRWQEAGRSSRLERILGFHVATIGSSHFCSVVDIVLGSLRYAVNSRAEPDRQPVAKQLLAQLAPMFIKDATSGKIHELGLFFSPATVKVQEYRNEYNELADYLRGNSIDCQHSVKEP